MCSCDPNDGTIDRIGGEVNPFKGGDVTLSGVLSLSDDPSLPKPKSLRRRDTTAACSTA
jgi:hypothetical protein